MRICMILEGCYPYIHGGVSNWMHEYILAFPEHEFVLWTIVALEKDKGVYKYDLPKNVVEVREIVLENALKLPAQKNRIFNFSDEETGALRNMIQCKDPDWDVLFDCYSQKDINPISFFISNQFLLLMEELCTVKYPHVCFSDLFYTIRSMFLPLLYLLTQPIPEADLYHATSCGYGGMLGSLATSVMKKPLVLTEHGIYSREREEEILRSHWIIPSFKKIWIEMFYMFSRCIYQKAVVVTALFENAKLIQQAIGCPEEKCLVIGNGIHYEKFITVADKIPDQWVDIGAVVRFAPIKDIKTMIYSFSALKSDVSNARLHILGGIDDREYFDECKELIRQLRIPDVLIVGHTDTKKYLEKLDFTILTSVSEGQPLSIIESFAAARPVVCTDVGGCRELVEGTYDTFGRAGICCPPMQQSALAHAMARLCRDKNLRQRMGAAGRARIINAFDHREMIEAYFNIYERVMRTWPA